MIQTAEKRGAEFEERMAAESSAQGTLTDRSAKAYYKEFKKVRERERESCLEEAGWSITWICSFGQWFVSLVYFIV